MAPIPQLNRAANVPTDNASTAGGAMDAAQITNAADGEWCPQLVAMQTGVIDTDTVLQYQLAYVYNAGDADWSSGGLYVDNLLIRPTTPGIINLVSTSADDNASKFVRVVGVTLVSAVLTLVIRDIVLNGTTPVSGTDTWVRVERLELRNSTGGLLATAAGRISATIGSGTPEAIGAIPAPIAIPGGGYTSYSYATGEHEYAVASVIGDMATYANRITDPFDGSGTWVRPNSSATMLALPATLTAGDRCGIYRRQTLQPGVPSCNPLTLANKLYGNA